MRSLALIVLVFAAPAAAQRRDGGTSTAPLEVAFTTPVRFGEATLPAGRYRLSVGEAGLSFSTAATMVWVANVKVETSTSSTSVTPATVSVQEKGDDITVVVKNFTDVLTARGKKVAAASKSDVELAQKQEHALEGGIPQATSEQALVDGALKRYEKDVLPCADGAHKNHWTTDDPRFVKCVCPFADKWRLPKVAAPLRVHRALAKGKSGFSVTVTPAGRAEACRVWVGPRSPEEVAPKEAVTP